MPSPAQEVMIAHIDKNGEQEKEVREIFPEHTRN